MARRLIDRIPPDVRARAEKAGMTDVDWYAGRMLPVPVITRMLPARRAELLRRARDLRRQHRAGRWCRWFGHYSPFKDWDGEVWTLDCARCGHQWTETP